MNWKNKHPVTKRIGRLTGCCTPSGPVVLFSHLRSTMARDAEKRY